MKMTVGRRVQTGFLLVAVMGAVVGAIGIGSMDRMSADAEALYRRELLGLSQVKEANVKLIYLGRSTQSLLLAPSIEERERIKGNMDRYLDELKTYLEQTRPLFESKEAERQFAEIHRLIEEYENALPRLVAMVDAEPLRQDRESTAFAFGRLRDSSNAMDAALDALSRRKETEAAEYATHAGELYRASRSFMLGLNVFSILVGLALGYLISRKISRQLGGEPEYAAEIVSRIADGDLTAEIALRKGDRSSLLYAMVSMRDRLASIVTEVRGGTDAIATASEEIASGNQELSSRTEQQASSLEETASSMEELTATVKQNADNAQQAKLLAASAADVASKGGEIVEKVVQTMASITASSHRIAEIVGVIDGIAFQTNILALNAAVEAARAGEQGRGFAVVAAEVRSLAQRAATSAQEIKALIAESVGNVEAGSQLVGEAGETMRTIVRNVHQVTDINAEIAAASEEQATGIDQVNQAVGQMDQVTQQNAALVEEAAAAASALKEQAYQLATLVGTFKVARFDADKQAHDVKPLALLPVQR